MGEASDNSLTYLTAGDIHALVVYLRSMPAQDSDLPRTVNVPAPASHRLGVTADLDPRGEKIFAGACASCHDWTGVSPLSKYATLTGVRAVNDPSATNVAQTVINGVDRTTAQGKIFMPAFGCRLFRRRDRGGVELCHRPFRRPGRAADGQGHRVFAQAGGAAIG